MIIGKKILQKRFDRHWKNIQHEHPLKWIELEVTRRCPLSCLHCGSSCSMETPYPDELSTDEILTALRRIAQWQNPATLKVAVTGGEPLARKDIFQLLAHITEMGYKASMVTNGLLIRDDRTVKLLAASGIRSVSLSVDGLEESHDWLRNRKGAFRSVIDAIRRLMDSGLFYVEPITVVNRRNFSELARMEDLMRELQVPSWRLGKTFPIGRAADYPELFIDGKQYRALLDFIKQRYTDPDSPLKVSYCEEGYLGPEYEMEVRSFFAQCGAGVNIMAILADGSITGCAAVSHDFIQGNIRTDDPVEVWENRFQVFRDRSWMRAGKCGDCAIFDHCRGDGLHLWDKNGLNPKLCNNELLYQPR